MSIWQTNAANVATTRTQHAAIQTHLTEARFADDLAAIRLMRLWRSQLGWGVDNSTIVRCVEVAYDNAMTELARLERFGRAS